MNQVGTPFIVVEESNGYRYALIGELEAIEHFKILEQHIKENTDPEEI